MSVEVKSAIQFLAASVDQTESQLIRGVLERIFRSIDLVKDRFAAVFADDFDPDKIGPINHAIIF